MNYDTRFSHVVFVATVLPDPAPHPHNACTRRTLASGRIYVEHVWGCPPVNDCPAPTVPCCCGVLTYGEVSN